MNCNNYKLQKSVRDARYQVMKVFVGYEQPRFVLYFCNERISQNERLEDAILSAIFHQDKHNFNLLLEA